MHIYICVLLLQKSSGKVVTHLHHHPTGRRYRLSMPSYVAPPNELTFDNSQKDLRKIEEAIKCYRKAIELNSKYADAYYNLGTAQKEIGKNEILIGWCGDDIRHNQATPQIANTCR